MNDDSHHHNAPATDPARRAFLTRVTELLSAAMAVLLAVPLVGFIMAPLFQERKARWVKLGPASKVAPDAPAKFVYSFPTTDAWLSKVQRGTVYAVAAGDDDYIVLSNVCTHAGCGVRWDAERKLFQCPCHNGQFDKQGKVLGGPPPHPLNRLENKVEDGVLFVRLHGV